MIYTTGTPVSSTTPHFVEAAEASVMSAGISAAQAQIVTTDQELIVGVTLSGGGDGHTFVAELIGSDTATGGTELDELARFGCYLAASQEELAVARAAALAVLAAESPPSQGQVLMIIDEQVAGAAKGTRFMGLIIAQWQSQG